MGQKDLPEKPWFVIDKNLSNNQLIVAQGHQNDYLLKHFLKSSQLHWTTGKAPADEFECAAKIRYRQHEEACHVSVKGDIARVCFQNPQRAITPGQSIVFYDQQVCLGGGIIDDSYTDCP